MRPIEVPGMVNAHSHAFQRQLRGVAERPAPRAAVAEDFWSWRHAMFALAQRLAPDSMQRLALRAYREMRAAGYTAVGEFHYVHHQPDGVAYGDPNAMAKAVARAAVEAEIEIVVICAAYHRNGWDQGDRPPGDGQRRFCDPDVETFLARVEALSAWAEGQPGVAVAVAAHSVRAVSRGWLERIAEYARAAGLRLHVHACEQPQELAECKAEHGCSPIALLHDCGFLGVGTSVIHAIHVDGRDISLLAESGATVVSCPTTEGSLGDGWVPALRYRDAGVRLAIGSDSQIRIDPFEECRELETGARREGLTRFGLLAQAGDLWAELRANGLASLGLADAATIVLDRDHADLRGIADADLRCALATCASAGVVVGQAPPLRRQSK